VRALDAVEAGIAVIESDPSVDSVGYGGLPDASGEVTLDACIMDHRGECGSVAGMRRIMNPIKVARVVMEKTPHVMIVGDAATRFAVRQGFRETNLLTPASAARYEEWKKSNPEKAWPPWPAGHDTIGMIALDTHGDLAGGCSTSGLAFKLPGRVGDSPIIGCGMYVDGEVGGAAATGVGEEIIKVCGSFAVVENMRRGMTPAEAIEDVLRRVSNRRKGNVEPMVCFVALRRDGLMAGASLSRKHGFTYAVVVERESSVVETAPAVF